jgi:uncharacterized protein (TIGR02271 family)
LITTTQARQLRGTIAYDNHGDKLGKVGQVYFDYQTDRPEFATVKTGLLGTRESFVPIAEANIEGDRLTVPYAKDQVQHAPAIDTEGNLDQAQEAELYRYYGLGIEAGQMPPAEAPPGGVLPGAAGRDVSGPTTDEAMTRSEEEIRVGTRPVEYGRVRLRKYVVTETVTQTVPVSHEEVRVVREPITEANREAAMAGPEISADEHEVVLHAEEPVVEKRAVPKERVRLDTETVPEQQVVSEQVRKERIDTEAEVLEGPDQTQHSR